MNKKSLMKQKELKTLQIGANQLAQRFTLWSWTKTPHSHISTPPCRAGLILIIILAMMIRMAMVMTMFVCYGDIEDNDELMMMSIRFDNGDNS